MKLFYRILCSIFAIYIYIYSPATYAQEIATTNGAINPGGKSCSSGGTPYHTPFTGGYTDGKAIKYSATEAIYTANEFNQTPYGVLNGIEIHQCSGDYTNSGVLWVFLKETPSSTTTVGTTTSTSEYSLVYKGSTPSTTGSFGWRPIFFNGETFTGSDLKGANGGANSFIWGENTNLSILMLYERSSTYSEDVSMYRVESNGGKVSSASRYIGGNTEPWIDGSSAMSQHQKTSIRVNIESPLPIELTSFTAEKETNYNKIDWETVSENNNAEFILHHSLDGENWYEIHRQSGAGNSKMPISYEHIDDRFVSGEINYYRLSQVDYDGKSETFAPVAVDNRKSKKLIKRINLLGQEVGAEFKGIVILYYDDNSTIKVVQ